MADTADTIPAEPSTPGRTWQEQATIGENPEDRIAVVAPNGKAGTVRRADLAEAMDNGFQLERPEATHERRLEKKYGDSGGEAFAEGVASTLTGGLSRAFAPERQRQVQRHNEGWSTLGEVGGAFIPLGAPGLIGKAGEAAAGLLGGESLLGGVGSAVVRGGVEGTLYGTQGGVEKVLLSEDPMTLEGAAATIGSEALTGGLVGGVIGGGAGLLGAGAKAAKEFANSKIEAISKAEGAVDRGKFPEIANMDQKAAAARKAELAEQHTATRAADIVEGKAAARAETEFLNAERKTASENVYKEAEQFVEDIRPIKINVDDSMDAKVLGNTKQKLMKGLDNKIEFADKRGNGNFLKALQEEETVLDRVLGDSNEVMANAEAHQAAYADALPRPKHELVPEGLPERPTLKPFPEKPTPALVPERPGSALAGSAKEAAWKKAVSDAERQNAKLQQDWEKAYSKVDRANQKIEKSWQKAYDAAELENLTAKTEHEKLYLSPEQGRRYADFAGVVAPEGKSLAVTPDELESFRRAIEIGDVLAPEVERVKTAQALMDRVKTMRGKIEELQAPITSPKLTEIENRIEVAKANVKPVSEEAKAIDAHLADLQTKTMGHGIAQGVGGLLGGKLGFAVGGPMGAVAGAFAGRDAGIRIYDRLIRKIVSGNTSRIAAIKKATASMFAKTTEKVAQGAAHSTKFISAIGYAPEKHVEAMLGPDKSQPSKSENVNQFRQRARELNSVTEPGGPGVYNVRKQALEAMHEQMGGVWAIAPKVANAVEKQQALKLQYLASKMPRDPSPPHLQLGPSTWEPTQAQIASFARTMKAVEHPEFTPQQLAAGTATPNDVEALKTVWPSHYEEVRRQCMDHAATLQRTLPYVQRLNLSLLLDIDVDPALTQVAQSIYQRPPASTQQQKPPQQSSPLPSGMEKPTSSQHASE